MAVINQCPQCGKIGKVMSDHIGKPVRCPDCQTRFLARLTSSSDYPIAEPYFPSVGEGEGANPSSDEPVKRGPRDMPSQIGRFQIRAWLGRGGFGDVYLAHDPVLERDVALKVPKAKTLNSPVRVAAFLREAKASARLRHPHIVPVFDSGQDDHHYYIATAFIEGRTLAQALEQKPFSIDDSVRIGRALAEALAYAHGQKIVHRDIKPGNIMLDTEGKPYIVDFGLAARLDRAADTEAPQADAKITGHPESLSDDDGARQTHLAEGGLAGKEKRVRMGTPSYWSPEQAAGVVKDVKAPTDQYSLGMVLYEMLCGQPAFSGPPHLLQAHAKVTPPPPPRSHNPLIPEDLEAICLKTLAKNPEQRYPSCQELADDLRRWLEGEETHARRWPTRERLKHWYKKEPLRAWAIGLAGLAGLAVLLLSILVGVQQTRAARDLRHEKTRTDQAYQLAVAAQKKADENARRAVENEVRTKAVLAEFALDRAQMFGEQRETGLALPWLARSLDIARGAGAADLEKVIRKNLAAWHQPAHALRASVPLPDKVYALALHPDGRIAYAASEGIVYQIDLREGRMLPEHIKFLEAGPVRAVALGNGARQLLAVQHRSVWLIDTRDAQVGARPIAVHRGQITALAVAPPRKGLPDVAVSSDKDGEVRLWTIPSGALLRTRALDQKVSHLAFSPCGQAVLVACADGSIRIWSTATGGEDWRSQPGDSVHALAFHPDGSRMLVARSTPLSGRAHLLAVGTGVGIAGTGKEHAVFAHQAEVHAVAFSPCGRHFVTAGRDRSARLWQTDSHQPLGRTLWHPAEVALSLFHPRNQGLITVDSENTLRLWELKAEPPSPPAASLVPFTAVHVSAGSVKGKGATIFRAQAGSRARVVDESGQLITEVDPRSQMERPHDLDSQIMAFALDASQSRLLTASTLTHKPGGPGGPKEQHLLHLWEVASGKLLRTFVGHNDRIFRVAFRPGDDMIGSVGWDGRAFVWDATSGEVVLAISLPQKLFALAFSGDGKRLALGGIDRTARIYSIDPPRREPIQEFKHVDSVVAAAFSPDGRTLLTGFAGGAQLWDLRSLQGYPLQHLTGVFGVGFSSDGATVVTAGLDQNARLWDRTTRKPIGPPLRHSAPVFAVALNDQELLTVTVPPGAAIHRWPLADPRTETLDQLHLWARLIANIHLDEHNTNQVIDGRTWSKLRAQLTIQDDWQANWTPWPAPPVPVAYRPQIPRDVAVEPVQGPGKLSVVPLKAAALKAAPSPEWFLPQGTELVAELNLKQILASRWAKSHKEQIDRVREALKNSHLSEAGQVFLAAKADFLQDVDRVLLGSAADIKTIVVFEGRFKALAGLARLREDWPSGAIPIINVGASFYLAVVNDGIAVGARDAASVREAVKRAALGEFQPVHKELAILGKSTAKQSVNLVSTGRALARFFEAGPPPLPKLADGLRTVEVLQVHATLDAATVRCSLVVPLADPETAAIAAKNAENLLPFLLKNVPKEAPVLAPLVNATIKTSARAHYFTVDLEMTHAQFDRLVAGLLPP